MKFSGVQKFTMLDYPGHTACIVFTPGCNFRCGYCHNPEFVLPRSLKALEPAFIDEATVMRFLVGRQGLLEGVVITGGEPTLHRDLPAFIEKIRDLGFRVKLDTNGSLPEILARLLRAELVDYVAMDVKTSLDRYPHLTGACVRPEAIRRSVDLIKASAPDYEFRTTLLREHHGPSELAGIAALVSGARRFALQGFRSEITLDPSFRSFEAFARKELETLAEGFRSCVDEVIIR